MECTFCPANSYSSEDNTILKRAGEQAMRIYIGYRTTCTECRRLTVSPEGSDSIDDCVAAYTNLRDEDAALHENGFCSRTEAGMPLVPIIDEQSCREAADSLGLTLATSGTI